MPGFYIEKVTAISKEHGNASISFGPGLNIIQGRSDSGKTCVAWCIDFAFGGATQKPFKQSAHYTGVVMTVVSYDGGEVTITRIVGRRTAIVESTIACIKSGTYDVDYKKGKPNPVLNTVWLQLMGIDGEKMVPADIAYTPKRLTWRNLLQLFYLDENRIDEKESIILPKAKCIANTLFLSSLLYLFTGKDFSKIDAQEKKEDRRKRKQVITEFVNRKLQEAAKKKTELEKALDIYAGADIEQTINYLQAVLDATQQVLDTAISDSQALLGSIMKIEEREAESNVLLSRFQRLQTQYKADIRRISFITEGEDAIGHTPQSVVCPFCEGIVSPHAKESYIEASKAELSRTVAQLDGLLESERDVQTEKTIIEAELLDLKRKRFQLETQIKEELKPKKEATIETIKGYKAYLQLRNEVLFVEEYSSDWQNELVVLDQEKDEGKLEFRPKEHMDDFIAIMSDYADSILRECCYAGFVSARFSKDDFDIVVNGEEKATSHGKGYHSYLNTVVALMFRKYLYEHAKYNPRMFVIDTPLHGFDEGVSDDMPESMRRGLYSYFVNHQEEGQLVIIENLNNIPNLPYAEKGAIVETFQKGKAPGRYGFLNITE